MINKKFLFFIGILMILYLFFAVFQWNKEVKYRTSMQNILSLGEDLYNDLDLLMREGNDQEINESCPNLMKDYYFLVSLILAERPPQKYKESHSYMRTGILNLNLGVVTICSGFKDQSKETVLQGFKIREEALNTMVEGQDILLIESKNKSLLERILTR